MDNRPAQYPPLQRYPQPPQYSQPQYPPPPQYSQPLQYPQNQIQIPLEPGPPPKKRWSRSKKWKVTGIVIAVLLVIGLINGIISGGKGIGDQGNDSQPTSTPTQAAQPLVENLTFQGDISGTLTTGINPQPLTHSDPIPDLVQQSDGTYSEPAPTNTQCSDFDSGYGQDYIAVIVGNVGTMRYAIAIEISESNPAYTKPETALHLRGSRDDQGSVEVYEMGGKNRRWQQVYGPALQDTTIVLHTDRASGTVDTWLATNDQSMNDASSTLHMQGEWKCG